MTREWGVPGRDSPERDQRKIAGHVWIDWAGPGIGPCLAETVQRGSRERFLVFLGMVSRKRTSLEMHHFYNLDKNKKIRYYILVSCEGRFSKLYKVTFYLFYSSSWSCLINPARPTPCSWYPFQNKTRNLFLLPAQTVSAKQGLLHGQVALCRHRTVTPNPALANPKTFINAPLSVGSLH